ncbi:MAG: Sir2 family NAD-dependent protein deacetylase [Verrucomicrobiota bacterium]
MNPFAKASSILSEADALLITAGAGMGVDSGLPDFRGNEGFWNAYPPYRELGKSFVEMANPDAFDFDPAFAWGFYGHRLELYRATEPHAGFSILRERGENFPRGCFVMTSNVDGHFQRAGFAERQIYEVHGSIHHLQCTGPCSEEIWSAQGLNLEVDQATMRATGDLPSCPRCDLIARPNILMFGDWGYLPSRNSQQEERLRSWLRSRKDDRIAILEFGAGSAVPTVRRFSEEIASTFPGATLIRVNPREPQIPLVGEHLSIQSGALEAIEGMLSC